jgi:nucleotide-binding universal stress UspA family protein
MAAKHYRRNPAAETRIKEDAVRGTLVCAVTDTEEGRGSLELSARLSERLGMRLVLVHAADEVSSNGEAGESVTMKGNREDGVRLLARLAAQYDVADIAEQRSAVGDPAALIAQIAAEEAADVIVIGARGRGRWRRRFGCTLARQLESETSVPVLIAPLGAQIQKTVAIDGSRR